MRIVTHGALSSPLEGEEFASLHRKPARRTAQSANAVPLQFAHNRTTYVMMRTKQQA